MAPFSELNRLTMIGNGEPAAIIALHQLEGNIRPAGVRRELAALAIDVMQQAILARRT